MKLLFLGFINPTYTQVAQKLLAQFIAYQNVAPQDNVHALIIGYGDLQLPLPANCRYFNLACFYNSTEYFSQRRTAALLAELLVKELSPDLIYCRYPLADQIMVELFRKLPPTVFEFQSKQREELPPESVLYKQEEEWGPQLIGLAAGLVGVTREIGLAQLAVAGKEIPAVVIPNGVEGQTLPLAGTKANKPALLFASADLDQYWQGADILVDAALASSDDFTLYLTGKGGQTLRKKSDPRLVFCGLLDREALNELASHCTAGICPLANHRKGLTETCTLKSREYAARGLPFWLAGDDPDFVTPPAFVLTGPAGKPPDFTALLQLARTWSGRGEEIRAWADEHLDWRVKMAELHSFLHNYCLNGPVYPYREITDITAELKAHPGNVELTRALIKLLLQPAKTMPATPALPLVSVIIPYYHALETIGQTISSVLNQSYPNLEVVIINDGDEEAPLINVLQELCEQKPQIEVRYYYQENQGLAATRNVAVTQARGKYILPLDADDLLAPVFLEQTVAVLEEHPEFAFCYTETLFFGGKNEVWSYRDFDQWLLRQINLLTCSALYRKEMWEAVGGYNTNMKHGYEDWDFWLSATEAGYLGTNIHLPLFLYRRREESMLGHRTEYDHLAKETIIENHPRLYKSVGSHNRDKLRVQTGVIPAEFIRKTNHRPDNNDKRVLLVCHDFPPYKLAGAQLYALKLAQALSVTGWQPEILHPVGISRESERQAYSIYDSEYEGLPVHRVMVDDLSPDLLGTNAQFAFANPGVTQALKSFLDTKRYPVVHTHLLYRLGLSLPLLAAGSGAANLATLHDYWLICPQGHLIDTLNRDCSGPEPDKCAHCLTGFNGPLSKVAQRFITARQQAVRLAWEQFNAVISPSSWLADAHAGAGLPRPQVNPLGWLSVPKLSRPSSRVFTFGYIGQITVRKGLDVLLAALHRLKTGAWRLVIWGSGIEPEFDQLLARLMAGLPIEKHGAYTPDDLANILAGMDVLVVPSRRENYPLTILEAFAAGLPVVASRVGGVPEIVTPETDGLLFESEDVTTLAGHLQRFLDDRDLAARLAANIKPVRNLADDARFYGDLYNRLRG